MFKKSIDGLLDADLFIYVGGGRCNWSIRRNGISLDPLKWRGICVKFQKKVVKGADMFCGHFCVGRGQYPPCKMVWCGGCYVKHPKYELPKSGKDYEGFQE